MAYAGTNEFFKYGHKAQEKAALALTPNENGWYSIPVMNKYWEFGVSDGKYGPYAKIGQTFFSINRGGFLYAKEGTEKGEAFVAGIKAMIEEMKAFNQARGEREERVHAAREND